MCYYSPSRIARIAQQGDRAMSALVNFINYQMGMLGKIPAQVADDGGLSRSALSYILTKEAKGGKPPLPEPETIKKLAKGLEVHPSNLTSSMGYPTDPIPDIDERLYALALQLLGAPWLAERIDDFLRLPRGEFDELMRYLDFHRPFPPGDDQSTP